MTVYVVPCGISLLDGLIVKKEKGPKDCKPSRLVKSAADLGQAVLGAADANVAEWWAGNAAPNASEARLLEWDPRLLCAETNTLAAGGRLGHPRELLDHGERLLLLASDTDHGIAAALYLAQYLAGLALPKVAYLSTPDMLTSVPAAPALDSGTLTVLRLRGLDPKQSPSAFVDAVVSIGVALRAAFDLGESMDVHLTGGFKATLLHTLMMTELLYSLDPDRVRACYVFEDTGSRADTLATIGLRQFEPAWCEDMRQELAAVKDREIHLGAQTFGGLVLAKDGKLNAFGEGFLAVLGQRYTPGRPGPGGA